MIPARKVVLSLAKGIHNKINREKFFGPIKLENGRISNNMRMIRKIVSNFRIRSSSGKLPVWEAASSSGSLVVEVHLQAPNFRAWCPESARNFRTAAELASAEQNNVWSQMYIAVGRTPFNGALKNCSARKESVKCSSTDRTAIERH